MDGTAREWFERGRLHRAGGPTNTIPGGLFVAFEGGDGAGKTTQRDLLAAHLNEAGFDVTATREPGGTDLGRHLRDVLLHGEDVAPRAEALMFAADRAHHVHTLIRPALERGGVVITDRYLDSSVAYQGAGRDLGGADIRNLSLWAAEGLLPDVTFLIDVPPGVSAERRAGTTPDRLESEPDEFHTRVRDNFLTLAADEPGRYAIIPGTYEVERIAAMVRLIVGVYAHVAHTATTGRDIRRPHVGDLASAVVDVVNLVGLDGADMWAPTSAVWLALSVGRYDVARASAIQHRFGKDRTGDGEVAA